MLSGDIDCLAEVVVPSVAAFQTLLNERLRRLPDVRDIRSNIALHRVKSEAPMLLGHLKRPALGASDRAPDCA